MRHAPLAMFAAVSLLPLALAGCSGGSSAGATEIELVDDTFEGGNRTLAAGTTIEFDNEGQHQHSVLIHKSTDEPTKLLLQKELMHEQSVDFTFSEPGTYHVWCSHHGTMTSGMAITITVQ